MADANPEGNTVKVSLNNFTKKPLYWLPVYIIVFSAFFDTHAQMPVLAPYAYSLGATPFLLGMIIGTYSLFNIIGNFTSGIIIDRRSWKLPLFAGLAAVTLILLLYPRAGSAPDLVLIRAGHGFMGGILVPSALACLTIGKEKTSKYGLRLAYFGAAIGLAAVTGPLFAGIIAARFGYPPVYYSLAGIMILAFIISLIPVSKLETSIKHSEVLPLSYKTISRHPPLTGAFFFAIGTMGATGTLASFLPLRAEILGLNPARTGMLFAAFALTAIIIQLIWPKILKPLLKEDYRGCMAGLILICLALILAALVNKPAGLFAALVCYGAGFGLSFQGMLNLVVSGSQPEWRGLAIGLFFAVYSLGVAIVPPLGGLIWQIYPAIFPFYTAAAATLISMSAGKKACHKQYDDVCPFQGGR